MSIATYAELVAEVESWANRTDLTVDSLIRLVEADLNKLNLIKQETSVDLTATSGRLTLPADFRAAKQLIYHYSSGDVPVGLASKASVIASWGSSRVTPTKFCHQGSDILLNADCTDDEFTLYYFTEVDPLPLNTTNWILTSYPQVYLFGCLYFAWLFLQNEERASYWYDKYQEELMNLQSYETSAQYSGGDLTVEPNPYMEGV